MIPKRSSAYLSMSSSSKSAERRPVIVHITTVPETLGFLAGQVEFLRRQGFRIYAITSPGEAYTMPGVISEFDHVYRVQMPRAITPFRDLVALFRVWRILISIRPDMVDAHTPKGGLFGMIGALLAMVPVRIYHMHGLPLLTQTGVARLLLKTTEMISCLAATQVICVSHTLRECAIAESVVRPGKSIVLLNGSISGVDTVRFDRNAVRRDVLTRIVERGRLKDGDLVVGYVGRLVKDKGIEDLVAAWSAIAEQFPRARLLIVGDFESRDAVSQHARHFLETEHSVRFLGRCADMPEAYCAMDLVVLPTYREGLSTVLLEAGAMMLPTVTTAVGGCTDVVENGRTGTIVPPRNVKSLQRAIAAYLGDPALRLGHGQAARAHVISRFSREKLWDATRSMYLELLARKK